MIRKRNRWIVSPWRVLSIWWTHNFVSPDHVLWLVGPFPSRLYESSFVPLLDLHLWGSFGVGGDPVSLLRLWFQESTPDLLWVDNVVYNGLCLSLTLFLGPKREVGGGGRRRVQMDPVRVGPFIRRHKKGTRSPTHSLPRFPFVRALVVFITDALVSVLRCKTTPVGGPSRT